MNLSEIKEQMTQVFEEFLQRSGVKTGQIVVIGCSTSEVGGAQIGKAGNPEIAAALFEPLYQMSQMRGIRLAFQCCEHLNRALVVTEETALLFGLEQVTVVPHPHAGGSLASHAYRHLPGAIVVEQIQAHAGLDIGETLIGMHLKPVAVPLRLSNRQVGGARINGATTRPKLIGGERAKYCL